MRATRPRATVIADASFCPQTRSAGWAFWITLNMPGQPVSRIKQSGLFHTKPKSSEQAELWAVYNGLWLAYESGGRDILVQTDCLAVVQNAQFNDGYQESRDKHWPEAEIEWRHVKGHTGRREPRFFVNNWCDEQAKKHMRKQRGNVKLKYGSPYWKKKNSR